MQGEKSKIVIWGVLLFFAVIIVLIALVFNKEETNIDDGHEILNNVYNYSEVYDYSTYQTVYQSLFEYYTQVNSNFNQVLPLLSEIYKKRYNISSDNIENYIEEFYGNFLYQITDIYVIQNSYFSIYYVEGMYAMELLDSNANETIVKDLVFFDIANNTYAILPIMNQNATFEEIIEEYGLMSYNQEILTNEYNTIPSVVVSNFREASDYFSEFLNKIHTDCYEAYELLGENTKNTYPTYEQFQSLCESYATDYPSSTIQDYQINYENEQKLITITDNYSIKYNFRIQSVKDYYVDISMN